MFQISDSQCDMHNQRWTDWEFQSKMDKLLGRFLSGGLHGNGICVKERFCNQNVHETFMETSINITHFASQMAPYSLYSVLPIELWSIVVHSGNRVPFEMHTLSCLVCLWLSVCLPVAVARD